MEDGVKVNEREAFLISTYGAAEAAKAMMSTLGQRFQPAALNNQFIKTDLTKEEIREISDAFHEGVMAMAKVMDITDDMIERKESSQ